MATYISTIKFTPQGVKSIDQTTKRAASVKATAKKLGVKVTDIFWTLGEYDGLLIFDAPDEVAATTMLFNLGAMGNVQTSTMRAFRTNEVEQMLANVQGGQ